MITKNLFFIKLLISIILGLIVSIFFELFNYGIRDFISENFLAFIGLSVISYFLLTIFIIANKTNGHKALINCLKQMIFLNKINSLASIALGIILSFSLGILYYSDYSKEIGFNINSEHLPLCQVIGLIGFSYFSISIFQKYFPILLKSSD